MFDLAVLICVVEPGPNVDLTNEFVLSLTLLSLGLVDTAGLPSQLLDLDCRCLLDIYLWRLVLSEPPLLHLGWLVKTEGDILIAGRR